MNALLFNLTMGAYFLATLTYLFYLFKPRPTLGRISHWVISGGFIIHCMFTLDRYLEAGHTPITNLHESLSFFSLAIRVRSRWDCMPAGICPNRESRT